MRLSIICPVLNASGLISRTLDSIVRHPSHLYELIIIDGGSTDGTLEVLSKYQQYISYQCSEPDNGIYDALVKGFKAASGEVVSYLNAGDFYHAEAIATVLEIFKTNEVRWLTGHRSVCNEAGQIFRVELPANYKTRLILNGAYGSSLPYIQQESTFWSRELFESVDFKRLGSFQLAGDYFLWWSFAHVTSIETVSAPLGVFCKHKGQLSEDLSGYQQEMESFVEKRKWSDWLLIVLELIIWTFDHRVRKFLGCKYIQYDEGSERWL